MDCKEETRQDKRQCWEIENQTKRNPRHNRRTLQNVDQMLVGGETRADTHNTRRERSKGRKEESLWWLRRRKRKG